MDSVAGIGVIGAEVMIEGTTLRAVTDERGEFRIPGTTRIAGTLRVRRLGFQPKAIPLGMDDERLRVQLLATAPSLTRVVVRAEKGHFTGRLAGYYERLERRSIGQFISRADLERERPSQLTDMLQRTPGIHVSRGRPGAARLQMRGRECVPLVWLDGTAMSVGEVDLDAFAPTTLEGIELYLGAVSAPSRYQWVRGKSECGTILLWSRGPDTEPKRIGRAVTPRELEAMIASATIYTADEVDSVAVMDEGRPPVVAYPPSLKAAKVDGQVVAEFVVDTLGQVEPEHFGIVSSSNALFSDSVREAIRGALFKPAVRQGRLVRQLVRQPFAFVIPERER